MKIFRSFLPFTCMIIMLCVTNNTYAQPSRFSREIYTNAKGDTLRYRLLYPDADTMRKYPLVIFLHGSGERGSDNDAQLKWGVMNFATDDMMKMHPCFVIAPQCPENISWSNFLRTGNTSETRLKDSATLPMQLVIGLVHKYMKNKSIDTNRIYITGLSMGGFGTYDAIERNPNLFAAAMPVCGGGDITKASLIAHLPIWIFHGAEDPNVSPQYTIDMLNALTKAGAHPACTFFPETGHFSWLAAYSDALAMEWLFRQHK